MSITLTPENKNTVVMRAQHKPGSGWAYDDPNITYDGAIDPISGNAVLYDGIGFATTMSAQSKNSVTMGAQTKS